MPIARLDADRTALIAIDLQERLLPTIVDRDQIVNNAAVLLRLADVLEMPYLVTEHYPAGLGRTAEVVVEAMADRSRRVEKTRFSALVDVVDEHLRDWERDTIIVCGIEAQVCVLQTVLDLLELDKRVFVVADAVSSRRPADAECALRRMRQGGAEIVTREMVAFEWLHKAATDRFRKISREFLK